jgi:parallel beta-helix repeat protein
MKTNMVCMAVAVALVLVFSLVAVIVPASPVSAQTTWYVDDDTCPDAGSGTAGDPFCKIQDAIDAASADDTIIIAAGQYNEHDLTINKSLTIQGTGSGSTIIDGQDISRVFFINKSTVDMSGMTIRNGNTTFYGGGIYSFMGNVTLNNCTVSDNEADYGGGIANNEGDVTLTNCTIADNHAADHGGGIYNVDSNLTMTNCTISGNEADGNGGGICNSDATMTLTNCTVSGNTAVVNGGGIYNNDELTMTNCTISGNEAPYGGGLYTNGGNVTMTNCTVSGNTADSSNADGGGIYNGSGTLLTMTNCTVSGNSAEGSVNHYGGGIYNGGTINMTNCTVTNNEAKGINAGGGGIQNDDNLTLKCTIVYGNTAPSDPNYRGGTYTDAGQNIVDKPLGSAPDPLLGPLRDNGGPTETHALLTGSPAIDACVNECTVDTDQRGSPRPIDGDCDYTYFCDIGAYEKQPAVGGIVEQVNRLELLAPWLALAALIIVSIIVLGILNRRRVA